MPGNLTELQRLLIHALCDSGLSPDDILSELTNEGFRIADAEAAAKAHDENDDRAAIVLKVYPSSSASSSSSSPRGFNENKSDDTLLPSSLTDAAEEDLSVRQTDLNSPDRAHIGIIKLEPGRTILSPHGALSLSVAGTAAAGTEQICLSSLEARLAVFGSVAQESRQQLEAPEEPSDISNVGERAKREVLEDNLPAREMLHGGEEMVSDTMGEGDNESNGTSLSDYGDGDDSMVEFSPGDPNLVFKHQLLK